MDGLDRIERHDEVPRILDVDHQLRVAVRCDLTHCAEHLATVSSKHLISYRDRVMHDAILRSACSVICYAFPHATDVSSSSPSSPGGGAKRRLRSPII